MEFLLKGFAKEFEAKHGATGNKKTKRNKGRKVAVGQTPVEDNAAKTQPLPKKKVNSLKKKSGTAGNCSDTLKNTAASAEVANTDNLQDKFENSELNNKENLLMEFENPELDKKQKKKLKKLRQKLRKQEMKKLEKIGGAAYDLDLPTTSAQALRSQTKLNDAEILEDKLGNESEGFNDLNINTPKQLQDKPTLIRKVNVPICCQAIYKEQSSNVKNKSCEMSSCTNKASSNNSINKDTKPNSTKNILSPSKVPNNTKDHSAKPQIETKSANLLKPLEFKQPRHCELLKPLIFPVPEGDLLSWAKQFQNMVLSLVTNSKQTTPFYVLGRHFDMRSTVTADKKVLDLFKQFLEERNAGYFSYTPKEQLRSLLVLKKPKNFKACGPNKIKKALLKLNIKVLMVKDFKSMWRPDKSYNRYLVEVSPDTNLQTLFEIKTLLKQSDWQWNKLKNPSITQCRNCQRYGHVASNCKMPYRCVKCENPHEAGECPRTLNDDSKDAVYCHNCKQTGHPSNYRGCSAYKERCEALKRHRESSRFSTVLQRTVMSVNKAFQPINKKK